MKTPKNLYSRLTLITVTTVITGYAMIYAWNTINSSEYQAGAPLTSTLMGKIIGNIDDLNSRVSNFSFSSGNIGIGIGNPNAKFDIMYTTGSHVIIGAMNGGVSGDEYLQFYWPDTNNISIQALEKDVSFNRNILLNPNGGNVGIGTASPTAKLHVQGVIKTEPCSACMGSCSSLSDNGKIYFNSDTNHFYGCVSNVRKQLDN